MTGKNKNRSVLGTPTPEEIAESERSLATNPRWQRMEFLHAKAESEGLTDEEEKELNTFGRPKFVKGDVIQEFMRAIERSEAEDSGKAGE